MRNLFNRILMLVGGLLIASTNSMAFDFKSDGIYYNILSETEKTVEVTFDGSVASDSYSGNITIPSTVNYKSTTYTVSGIGTEAFKNCNTLKSVILPSSITNIGASAFIHCGELLSVRMEDRVISIGDYAFSFCFSLSDINLSNSLTNIGSRAFAYCNFSNVIIPKYVYYLGTAVFEGCYNLQSITVDPLNKSFCSIDGILYNKAISELVCCPPQKENVSIPNTVASIGEYAFYYCQFTSIILPDSLENIGNFAFSQCFRLPSILIPDSVIKIGDCAFMGCDILSSLTIPNSVISIGTRAFQFCSISSITIPKSVRYIGDGICAWCSNLTYIDVEASNLYYCSLDGILFDKDMEKLLSFPAGKTGYYSIPNSVKTICDNAFAGCEKMANIDIPSSVTSIGSNAFNYCIGITQFIIPDTVTEIKDTAFSYCQNLKSITLPNSLQSIRNQTFSGCRSLDSILIPKSVKEIEYQAFTNCNNLKGIYCEPSTPPSLYYDSFDPEAYNQATLYVPFGSKNVYESAALWWNFTNIEQHDFSGIGDVADDAEVKVLVKNGQLEVKGVSETESVSIYSISGELIYEGQNHLLPTMTPGIFIIKVGSCRVTIRI